MKITKKQLKRIIKEEKTELLEYLDDVGGDKGAHVVDYLRTQARSYHNAGRDLDVDGDGVPDVSAIKTLLQDDFMDNFGHEFDIADFGYEISNFANGAGLQESKKMKITKRQLGRIIREQSHGAPAGWTKADWDAKNYNAGYEDALDGKEPNLNTPTPDRSAYARGYMAGAARSMREGQENKKMKITKRQLRRIIKEEKTKLSESGFHSISPAGKSLSRSIKGKFMRMYPDAKVGIDGRGGFITVNGVKAIDMSQATGRGMSDEEMIDKMHAVYAQTQVDSDVPTADTRMETFREGRKVKITKRQFRRIIKEEKAKLQKEAHPDYEGLPQSDIDYYELADDYALWVEDFGQGVENPSRPDVMASYFLEKGLEDDHAKHEMLGKAFRVSHDDIMRDIKRQQSERSATMGESATKIAKVQLVKIVREAIAGVAAGPNRGSTFLDLTMRAIEASDYRKASSYIMDSFMIDDIFPEDEDALISALSALPSTSRSPADVEAVADQWIAGIRRADEKAAEEILSTRMGSYKGTTLPGGKKL